MTLKYADISEFARQNGDVRAWANKSAVTLLKSGNVDSVKFLEEDAVLQAVISRSLFMS